MGTTAQNHENIHILFIYLSIGRLIKKKPGCPVQRTKTGSPVQRTKTGSPVQRNLLYMWTSKYFHRNLVFWIEPEPSSIDSIVSEFHIKCCAPTLVINPGDLRTVKPKHSSAGPTIKAHAGTSVSSILADTINATKQPEVTRSHSSSRMIQVGGPAAGVFLSPPEGLEAVKQV